MSKSASINKTSRSSRPKPTRLPERLLRNRGFLLLWAAYGISAMGDHISEVAVLKAKDALHEANAIQLQSMITFMFFLPYFVLGPFNGLIADRLPRRGIMIFADLARALLMLNFGFLLSRFEALGTTGAFIPFMFIGVFAALFSPARLSLLPSLVRDNQLVQANALTSGLGVIASMVAFLVGGQLAQHFNPLVAFRVDAVTFVVSAACLWFILPPQKEVRRHHPQGGLSALADALRYLRGHRRIIQLILVAVIIWSLGAVVHSTIPAVVRNMVPADEYYAQIGIMRALLGLGMLTGALLLAWFGDALRGEVAVTWGLIGVAASLVLLAAGAFMSTVYGGGYALSVVAVICSGIFASAVIASYNALMQRILPNRMRGRIFGFTDLAAIGGLLLATGTLGLVDWPDIDQWTGWVLLGVAGVVAASGIISLVIRVKGKPVQPRHNIWGKLNEFYCKFWFRLKREGPCTVPASGAVIVVSNHTCSIDPLLLIASTPHRPIGFLVAEEYVDIPVFRRLMQLIECVPVRRNSQDAMGTRAAIRHLREGKALGIFIEGRIAPPGVKLDPKSGAAMLALHTNALVVPAHISGTKYDDSLLRSFFRRHHARVRFGKPIDFSRYWIDKVDRESLDKVSRMLMRRINELGEDEDDENQSNIK
jgi:1-acyl-sn-glycerol-3-phosphate acyltransferase